MWNDKNYLKNIWRPISLLNVDTKILTKSLAEKLKNVLPELISFNQTAYVKNRCISESSRLISDVIEMCDILDIPGYLVTIDIEKAFDSLDHDFLLFALLLFALLFLLISSKLWPSLLKQSLKTQKKLEELEIMYLNGIYICLLYLYL